MSLYPTICLIAALGALWPALAATAAETPEAAAPASAVDQQQLDAIEAAAPDAPPAKPQSPRRVLVYGRLNVPINGHGVLEWNAALAILGKKTGAFTVVTSDQPSAFLPDNLRTFDAVVMNSTHEATPLLPMKFKDLSAADQAEAKAQEIIFKKSLLDFVAGGKGIIGIKGAIYDVQWREYNEMFGGWGRWDGWVGPRTCTVRIEDPGSPICRPIDAATFSIEHDIYSFSSSHLRETAHVLMTLDIQRTPDPGRRKDGDYPLSWVKRYGQGRVFYTMLGNAPPTHLNPVLLRHMLAGMQYALGDLTTDDAPSGKNSAAKPGAETADPSPTDPPAPAKP